MSRVLSLLAGSLLILGCGSNTPSKNPSPPKAETKPGAVTPDTKPTPDSKPAAAVIKLADPEAMKKAKDLYYEGKYAESAKAYGDIAAAVPYDPQPLIEKGLSEEQGKDFKAALEDTQKALALTKDPQTQAQIWAQSGDIFNDQEKYEDAIAAYQKAVALSPDSSAKSSLDNLLINNGTLPTAPLLGPYATIEDYCKKNELAVPKKEQTGTVGELEVEAFTVEGDAATKLYVAIKTSAGWFIKDGLPDAEFDEGGASNFWEGTTTVSGFTAPPAASTAKILVHLDLWVQYRCGAGCDDPSFEGPRTAEVINGEGLLICGLGPSGKPSCTDPIQSESAGSKVTKLSYSFLPDGSLKLKREAFRMDNYPMGGGAELEDHYQIVFP